MIKNRKTIYERIEELQKEKIDVINKLRNNLELKIILNQKSTQK